jgi:DNA helicase HerA-like ATPase
MISLGTIAATHAACELDLTTLLETRMLVQANSGGGKSYALRRLLEQTAPSVQQLIIDPEGEFASLREKFDYVIAAPQDGDAVATPQTAALLARRLLESGVSAILNIYELKAHERILFVRRFLDALVNAPKSLWHPVIIALDEAHVFAPQVGSAESLQAVSDIATRGRKRGQCLIAATQRLSKLHKDVAAELGNKMIGRTGLDVDVKRAADELGFSSRDATESLRNLEAGEFYVFGPALTRSVEKMKVGAVQTTHPKAGHRTMEAPPAPSAKVRAQLAKLADLQKDAEQEARTVEELKADNAKLRREATLANKRAEQAGVPEADVQKPHPRRSGGGAARGKADAGAGPARG